MKYFIIIIGLLFLTSCKQDEEISGRQASHFLKFIGNSGIDTGNDIIQTSDGGYILVGSVETSDNGTDIYVSKLNEYGNVEWERTIGDSLDDVGNSLEQTVDGGFVVIGTQQISATNTDILLLKFDALGNEEWRNTFGGLFLDEGVVVKQTRNNGYILGGNTTAVGLTTSNVQDKYDIILYETTSSGDSLGRKVFGYEGDDVIADVVLSNRGGYILLGTSRHNTESDVDISKNIFVVETDETLEGFNTFTLGEIGHDASGSSIERLPDGDFLISGAKTEIGRSVSNIYLSKLTGNDLRTQIFELSYQSPISNEVQFANDAVYSWDDSYVLTGAVRAGESGLEQVIVKVNTDGRVVWEQTYGGLENDVNNSIVFTGNSGYITIGNSISGVNSIISITKVNIDGELK